MVPIFIGVQSNLRPRLEIQFHSKKKINGAHRLQTIGIVKEAPTKEHPNEIFNVYQQWINGDFSINIDLEKFDTNNLVINVVSQITPKYLQTGTNMTSIQDKAVSHLNCDDYLDTYKKFNEIKGLQNDFNNSMKQFLDIHKNNLIQLINQKNLLHKKNLLTHC